MDAPSSKPRVRINDTGLSILYDPKDAIADIVFVHGLQGHPRKTWACPRAEQSEPPGLGETSGHSRTLKKIFSRKHRSRSQDTHRLELETVFWPLDFLVEDCANSRILTWGYDSRVSNFFGGAANQSNIGAHAQNLLRAIKHERLDCQGRRLIFIAHSFGGIIAKDVFHLAASADDDPLLLDIYTSTEAIFFFGTPHRGSNQAETLEIVRRIVSASGFDAADQNLRALQVNGSELERIHAAFMKLFVNQSRHSFRVITFKEGKGLSGIGRLNLNKRVVEPFSSSITDTEPSYTINANHMDMCRFQSKTDEGYRQVIGELKMLLRKISEEKKQIVTTSEETGPANLGTASPTRTTASKAYSLNDTERKCIALLTQNMSNVAEYRLSLPNRVEGTCQWILSNQQYRDWDIQKETCLLWIIGYPGSGKTILSAYLLEHLEGGSFSPSLPKTLCYFFCDDKIETQRDATAILRSIIHQLVDRNRRLIKHVKSVYDIQGPHFDQSFQALWKIFVAICCDRRAGPIIIIVDALDECDKTTRDWFLKNVIALMGKPQSVGSKAPYIKFLVTSRPFPGAPYTSNLLKIDPALDYVEEDLRMVIQSKVDGIAQRTGCGPEMQAYIENALRSRADRTFLWVTLVLELLEAEMIASPTKFKQIVDKLPKDLTEVYERFLNGIPSGHQQEASRFLHLIVGAQRPLTLGEMRTLFSIQDYHSTIASLEEEAPFSIQKTIEGVLGPLVRIWDSRIYLVHQSLKDFLQALATTPDHPLSATFGIDPGKANLVLAKSCVSYLSLDDFEQDLFSQDAIRTKEQESPTTPVDKSTDMDAIEQFWDSMNLGAVTILESPVEFEADACTFIANKYPLFDYAARHWAEHFLLADPEGQLILQKPVIALSDTIGIQGSNWFRFYWFHSEINLPRPQNFDPIVTASYFGHVSSLKSLLQEDIPIESNIGMHGIYWASRRGHRTLVDFLLDQGISPDAAVFDGQTCLIAAVQFNHLDVVNRLLEDEGLITEKGGYRVNHAARGGRTPLSIAAGNGHTEIVKKLLQHPQIQPDIEDNDKWTPLFWSISGKHLDVVQHLTADSRVSVNHLDRSSRSVLSWAASEGQLEIVKHLLSLKHIKAEQPDIKGRTALSWAAGNGHLQTTECLRRSQRIDVSKKDNDGRNAISWACSGCHIDVLKYLIKHDPSGVDEPDIDGWAPLAWALFRNSPETVQVLLDSGLVDVNKKDKGKRSALGWSASYGYIDVVRILLNTKGIEIDDGAMKAAESRPEILKLLQEHKNQRSTIVSSDS
ncbi:hypothetical protein F5884DRAFT_508819 [Xylogone sp. PMI_703]|nr:hypothetical protein F5884DRAFT_508819 [Xylogone sp. PMI_703]